MSPRADCSSLNFSSPTSEHSRRRWCRRHRAESHPGTYFGCIFLAPQPVTGSPTKVVEVERGTGEEGRLPWFPASSFGCISLTRTGKSNTEVKVVTVHAAFSTRESSSEQKFGEDQALRTGCTAASKAVHCFLRRQTPVDATLGKPSAQRERP
jgi:hypothetical protein